VIIRPADGTEIIAGMNEDGIDGWLITMVDSVEEILLGTFVVLEEVIIFSPNGTDSPRCRDIVQELRY
jgi:hypothetical protein